MVQRKKVSKLVGVRFGRLTVVEYLGKGKFNKHYWECVCECGGNTVLNSSEINNNYVLSCGCLRKEALKKNRADPTTHGHTINNKNLYAVYHQMLQRCYNEKAQRYKSYGAKGIQVCTEWLFSVDSFITWALDNGYASGLSIDRVDSKGNYEPSNCQWVTVSENSRKMNEARRNEKSTGA